MTSMYKLVRSGRDDDYIAVEDSGKIMVVSSMLRHIWENPDIFFGHYDKEAARYTFESYYGDTKENILSESELLWSR